MSTPSAEHQQLMHGLLLAASAAKLAFWRHDVASGEVQWSPSAEHPFVGDDAQADDLESMLSTVVPEDQPAVLAARELALRSHTPVELEYRICDAQGAVRHLLTCRLGRQKANGETAEVVGVLMDVTAQREREIKLQRLGTQQALALKALHAGCYRFDLASRQFEFDAAMRRLYGLPDAASLLAFEAWLALVLDEDRAWVQRMATALFEQPTLLAPVRFRIRHADGRVLWLETDRVLEHDAKGRIVALVGTHRDVTAEVKARAQARALADAQLVARTRAEFLATLAHELRTPLNAVTGFAQLLQMGVPGSAADPVVAAHARHIRAAGEMMVGLLNDLGDLASADAGVLRWQPQRLPVAALISDSCAWLQLQVERAAQRIQIEESPADLCVWADATRTRQIVLNLLSNALKYSEGVVQLRVEPALGLVRISVQDAGAGLDAAQLARAFEPFERLGREGGGQPGSGLGLAVCRRLARLMGGEIEVRSVPGEGSLFTLVLPAAGLEASA